MNETNWQALHDLVEQWAQIVSHVERGYSLSFDDYLNDLDLRRRIDEHVRQLSVARDSVIPESLTIKLHDADDRFRRVTTSSAENVWGAANERDEGWNAEREWYYYQWPEGWLDS